MSEVIYTKEQTEKLVPHSGKMFLLSRIAAFSIEAKELTSEVDILPGTLFLDSGMQGVPVWIGFEYMAQSISALSGIYNRERNTAPQVGFIMSVTGYTASVDSFPLGKCIQIQVRQTLRMDQAVTFEGVIFMDGKEVAHGVLNTVEVSSYKVLERE
ncbi:MAG: thioester dehydrase [Fibrobacter sp.]|jgi:predicted hotdog family 3-hydroxylacyl-ACP dehydratase|nr:thioester dehydrase [Fibrobacter sp.]